MPHLWYIMEIRIPRERRIEKGYASKLNEKARVSRIRGGESPFTKVRSSSGDCACLSITMAVATGERDSLSHDLNQERERDRMYLASEYTITHAEIRAVPLTAAR